MTLPPAACCWERESNWNNDEEVVFQARFRDPDTGVQALRLTSFPAVNHHIYPEAPISSADGRLFTFARRNLIDGARAYWLADIEWRAIRRITDEPDANWPLFPRDGSCLYYSAGRRVMRVSLDTFEREQVAEIPTAVGEPRGVVSISHDMKCMATATRTTAGSAAVAVVDIARQKCWIAYERDDAPISHLQFSRNPLNRILFQVNDGYEADREGNCVRLIGDRGASLHVVNADGGEHVQLNVGFSTTERVQGHQCWVGAEDRVITTLHRRTDPRAPWVQDRIVTIVPGADTPVTVGAGEPGFTHIHTSSDGAFWVSDCNRTARVYVGSLASKRHRLFCSTAATFGGQQYTHPHPFFLGGDRTIGWNSDASGIPHVFVGRIPDGFAEEL